MFQIIVSSLFSPMIFITVYCCYFLCSKLDTETSPSFSPISRFPSENTNLMLLKWLIIFSFSWTQPSISLYFLCVCFVFLLKHVGGHIKDSPLPPVTNEISPDLVSRRFFYNMYRQLGTSCKHQQFSFVCLVYDPSSQDYPLHASGCLIS